jgi:putative membrane protein
MRIELSSRGGRGPAEWTTQWLISALGLTLAARWFDGVEIGANGVEALLMVLGASALLGLLNLWLKPLLLLITLPVNVLTLGLFTLVVNGLVLWAAAALVPGFHIHGLGSAVLTALFLSIFSLIMRALVGGSGLRVSRGPTGR